MTLPFRRRHHDAESGHDRARMLMSDGLLVDLEPDDAAWLGRHLDGCAECGRDWKAFRADHRLLREPPRARSRSRRGTCGPGRPRPSIARPNGAARRLASRAAREQGRRAGWRAFPLGAAAGVVVLAVFIGSRFIANGSIPNTTSAPGSVVGASSRRPHRPA